MIDQGEEVLQKIKQITDLDLKLRLIAIASLVDKKKVLDKEQDKEIRLIEKKFNQVFFNITLPFYQSTNDIVSGSRAVTQEEITNLDQYLNDAEKNNKEQYLSNQDPINGYWLQAFKNAQPLKEDIKPKDEPILQFLNKVEAIADAENDDFEIVLTFDENDFFTNKELRIKYFMKDETDILKTEATPIGWKEGKDITKKLVKKKNKNKKVKVKEVEQESFFNLFKSIDSTSEAFKALPKEQQSELEFKIGVQYEIGAMIYNEIIPFSLEYYLGVKVNEDYDDEDDGEEDEEEVDSDENITKEEALQRLKARFQGQGKKK